MDTTSRTIGIEGEERVAMAERIESVDLKEAFGRGVIPEEDFKALDEVRRQWGRVDGSVRCLHLVRAALRLASWVGSPRSRPLAALAAWNLLDPSLMGDAAQACLSRIMDGLLAEQASSSDLVVLDPVEVELIGILYERLNPENPEDLVQMRRLMELKMLSVSRLGLLRRFPTRVKRLVKSGVPAAKASAWARAAAEHLDGLAQTAGWELLREAAATSRESCAALAERLAPPPAQQRQEGRTDSEGAASSMGSLGVLGSIGRAPSRPLP